MLTQQLKIGKIVNGWDILLFMVLTIWGRKLGVCHIYMPYNEYVPQTCGGPKTWAYLVLKGLLLGLMGPSITGYSSNPSFQFFMPD
jgi:hypothetical protein